MQHCGQRLVVQKHSLLQDGDRLPGEVARWGWCKVCRSKGMWAGFCGRGHQLDVLNCRRAPYERPTKYGYLDDRALVCQEGECFEYDEAWLAVSLKVADMSYDEFDAFAVKLGETCAGIKYQSPKTTWQERLRCDLLAVVPYLQGIYAEQRQLEEYDAKAAEERSAEQAGGDLYGTFESYVVWQLLDVEL